MNEANHRVRESCLICEGSGKSAGALCAYCAGTGIVFARSGAPKQVLLATGDCKVPMRKKFAEGVTLSRKFS